MHHIVGTNGVAETYGTADHTKLETHAASFGVD